MRRAYHIEVLKGKKWQNMLLLILGLLCALSTTAQVKGWERLYGGGVDEGRSIIQTADEGFALVGNDDFGQFLLIKTDPDGNEIWSNTYGENFINFSARDLVQLPDGGYVLAGNCNNCGVTGGNKDIVLIGVDKHGTEIWRETYGGGFDDDINAITLTTTNELVLIGSTDIDNMNQQIYLIKTDLNGLNATQRIYGNMSDEVGNDILETPTGFIATGYSQIAGFTKDLYIINFGTNLDSLSSVSYGGSFEQEGNAITFATDEMGTINGYVITGSTETIANGEDLFVLRTDLDGGNVTSRTIGEDLIQRGYSIDNTNDGGYIIAGSTELNPNQVHALLIKLDNNLQDDWTRTFGSQNLSIISLAEGFGVQTTKDGGYVMTGYRGDLADQKTYIVKTDSEGDIFTNIVKGRVFNSSTNAGIKDWVVEAKGENGADYFGTTDANGNYTILLENSDDYLVELAIPNPYWKSNFGASMVTVTIFDTLTVDFPVFTETQCTDVEVDITAPFLTPGTATTNYYAVRYCNHGTLTAENAFVDIELDEDLILMSSTQDYVQIDSIYRFELGSLPFGTCDSFFVNVFVATTEVQKTHCTKAQVYPNVICEPIGIWDQASIKVDALCDGDSVRFNIENQGTGNSTEQLEFIIVEDIVLRTEQPQLLQFLGSGETQSVAYEATGGTFRIFSDQSTGHPGDSRPTAAIEGCGGLTPGLYTQFPENDYDHSISIDCQENLASSPSQLKRGYPKGYGEERKIAADTDLGYHLKFQNIGTETAIRVVIRDTISPLLDPSTIRAGASSHDYEFEVYGDGILKFTFEDILLPGSSTNEDASHIFVKFRVSQKPGNEIDGLIKNYAAATFEYNAPIINGDPTCHKIGGLEWIEFITVDTDEVPFPGVNGIVIYPNPMTETATIEVESEVVIPNLSFNVFDMMGRQLRMENFDGMTYQFSRQNLSAGIYIYQIKSAGQLVRTGKMIVK